MFEKPVCKKGTKIVHKYGYGWCGGNCRWGTTLKLRALKNYIGDNWDYVAIAADETERIEKERRENKVLPLVEMGITEAQALQYCYDRGIYWEQNGVRLYEILARIKESLTRYFSADRSEFPEGFRDIESDYNQLPGEPYPTIAINDVGNDDRMIEFYVTGKQYDVYHVAFKGFTKG